MCIRDRRGAVPGASPGRPSTFGSSPITALATAWAMNFTKKASRSGASVLALSAIVHAARYALSREAGA
eukprot:7001490-Alexandrium_andersonii.AAC.1